MSQSEQVVTIEVNGRQLQAKKGSMVIEATDAAGIYIPRFCYHHKLSVAANCRMCLIEIEKAPKPMPACATPVADGMKVFTHSETTRDAQKGVMEFLLINHPLDCPVCDQGGECPLQDEALGYGKGISRFSEGKRVVPDENIGSLIATYMTRCIHCTRCVRFGQEIAGVMEFGAIGRGEHTEIRTFIDRSVASELSGNVIDLCPVGALTSKPFQFKARAWELEHHPAISPHDSVGSHIDVQTLRGRVLRVLPRVAEEINECWLSDRDRFSYEGLNSPDRLTVPMVRRDGGLEQTDWNTALAIVAEGIRKVIDTHGADQIGALVAPTATLEEIYLLQKLMRSLGSGNIDHRLRQIDFSDDPNLPVFPWLGQSLPGLEKLDAVLLVGANPRKDQPLIGHRLRKAHRRGAKITAINPVDYEFTYPLAAKVVVHPADMVMALAGVAKAVCDIKSIAPPTGAEWIETLTPSPASAAIAEILANAENATLLFGQYADSHPQASALRALMHIICELTGAKPGYLPGGNAAGAWLAGGVPHRGVAGGEAAVKGRNVAAMLREPLKAYVLLGLEPELDCLEAGRAHRALKQADFVVALSAFKPPNLTEGDNSYNHVLLPLAPFTETAGTFVNAEGRVQSFQGAVPPAGEARPGWKILRVLGNLLKLPGFDQDSIADVRAELDIIKVKPRAALSDWQLTAPSEHRRNGIMRITQFPIYAVDAVVRRASSLQRTLDNPGPAAHLNAPTASRLALNDGDTVTVSDGEYRSRLMLVIDPRLPDDTVLIPTSLPDTWMLSPDGPLTIEKVSA